jgi:hypothetical protein
MGLPGFGFFISEGAVKVNTLAADEDVMRFGAAVEQKIKGGEIGQEVSPELRIHGSRGLEKNQFDPRIQKQFFIEIFCGRRLGQEPRGAYGPADLNEAEGAGGRPLDLRKAEEAGVHGKRPHEIAKNLEVEFREVLELFGEDLPDKVEVVTKIRRPAVGGH